MMNNIVIDELKTRISSVQMVPMKHCTEHDRNYNSPSSGTDIAVGL